MIELKGNIFQSSCEAIVNPVNCTGVMGAGLAKQFKLLYPQNFLAYQKSCLAKTLIIGTCLTVRESDKMIINFPTKIHWKNCSKYEYIEAGLKALARHISYYQIKSIAIPALGCGLGGLDFQIVRQLIEQHIATLPKVHVELYLP